MNKQTLNKKIDEFSCTLQSTQEWFATILTHRMGENDTIQSYSPNGILIAEEAARYIIPSPTLQPHQRMQIYNQQYWWRLLNTLHLNFPLVTRLFGFQAFNEQIGIPFILKYPPCHWSLTLLGESLPKWVMECYQEPDQSLIYNAASLDWAYTASFIAPQFPPLDLSHLVEGNQESLLSHTFYLQSHIYLFTWEYDLMTFRGSFVKQEVDYWVENPFPELPKGKAYYFILYRNGINNIAWREISKGELLLLECFKKGTSIESVCEYIETQETSLYEEMETNLQNWMQNWTQAGWLTLTQPPN